MEVGQLRTKISEYNNFSKHFEYNKRYIYTKDDIITAWDVYVSNEGMF